MPQLQVAIRADASEKIGIGHVMRCLTLANGFPKDTAVTFFSKSLLPKLASTIQSSGYKVQLLPDTFTPIEEPFDLLIVDQYETDAVWEMRERYCVKKIFVIDDIPNRPHDADFFLDQNFSLEDHRYDKLLPLQCRQMLGPSYALLRKEFPETRKNFKRDFGPIRSILINMGGTDPKVLTPTVLRALKPYFKELNTIDIVTTSGNPRIGELAKLTKEAPDLISLHVDSPEYVSLMCSADLAIAAGGSSSWERLCLGLPTIQLALVENQLKLTKSLAHEGYVMELEDPSESFTNKLRSCIEALRAPFRRKEMSKRGMSLVDGKGCERVVAQIL